MNPANEAIIAAAQAAAQANNRNEYRAAVKGLEALLTLRELAQFSTVDGRTGEWLRREWVVDEIALAKQFADGGPWEPMPLPKNLRGPFKVAGLDAATPHLWQAICASVREDGNIGITVDDVKRKLKNLRAALSREGNCRCYIVYANGTMSLSAQLRRV